ncbi:MAG TPA: hypothetical protein VGZ25_07475 [Gemmataceae bacterium]|jgi:hypothetical protein|nr:hypothetical protein [Gemmataceae bacterium]
MNAPATKRFTFLPWIGVFLLFGLGALMFITFFGLTRALGFDRENIYAQLARLDSERARTKELQTRDRAFIENIEGKKQVIKAVIDERLTLREAAAQFQTLNLLCPEYDWEGFRRAFPGRTDEERHCRQVLACLRLEVTSNSGRVYALVARLETEFDRDIIRS